MQKRNLLFGAALVLTVGAAGCASDAIGGDGAQMNSDYSAQGMVPLFQVDPVWPKPLPNHWIMGATIGVDVDSHDNIWLVHRNTPDQFVARTDMGCALRVLLRETERFEWAGVPEYLPDSGNTSPSALPVRAIR